MRLYGVPYGYPRALRSGDNLLTQTTPQWAVASAATDVVKRIFPMYMESLESMWKTN